MLKFFTTTYLLKFSAVFIAVLFIPIFSRAAGIQIAPDKLTFNPGGPKTMFLKIKNSGPKAQTFQVYIDDQPSIFQILPDDFSLAPNESKEITISLLQIPKEQIKTHVSVLSFGLGNAGQSAVGTGIKIPLTVFLALPNEHTKTNNKHLQETILAIFLAVILISLLTINKSKNNPS